MSTKIRQHLVKAHEAMASHHADLGSHFDELAKCFGKARHAGHDDNGASEHFAAIAKAHHEAAAYHEGAGAECEKTDTADFEKRFDTESTRAPISLVAAQGPITAIPRTGAPEPPGKALELTFGKLFSSLKHEGESEDAVAVKAGRTGPENASKALVDAECLR